MRTATARPLPLAPSTKRAVWASAITTSFVALVAATPRSPFHSVLPRGLEPGGPFRIVSDVIGLDRLGQTGLFLVGILATTAAALAFLLVLREAWHNRLTLRHVLVMAVAFHIVVLMLPLLFSRDAYSYAYIGKIVTSYGGNPWVDTPRDYNLNSLFKLTWPGWRSTPSVYGPLFTWVSVLLTGTLKSIPSLITGFQLVAMSASLGTTWLVARTVQRAMPERTVFAAAIVGLNPIVVFHVVGGGHNDMLVALFVAVAGASLFSGRKLAAAVALGLAISVKATAAIPLLLLLVVVAAAAPSKRRLREVAVHAGAAGIVWLVLAFPFLQTTNPLLGLFDVADNSSWMAPGQLVVQVFDGVGGFLGGDGGADTGSVLARLLVFGASATGIFFIAREIWRRPEARTPRALAAAWAWGMLVLILPSPVLFTWYLVWILPLAWALPRVPRRALVALSVFFFVTQVVTESSRLPDALETISLPFGHPVAIAVLFWVARDLIRRLRSGTLLHVETDRPQLGDRFERGPEPRLREVASTEEEADATHPDRSGAGARPRAALDRVASVSTRRSM
jgi:alpha-1,6-mannosyltransferase